MPTSTKPDAVISAISLKELVDRSQAFALKKKEGDNNLMGILLTAGNGCYEASSTNSHVLSKNRVISDRAPADFRVWIPFQSLGPISRLVAKNKEEDVKIILTRSEDGKPKQLFIRTSGQFYGTALPIDQFPSIPSYDNISGMKGDTVTFETGGLLHNVIGQIQAFSPDGYVSFTLGEERIVVKAGNGDNQVEEDVPVTLLDGAGGRQVGFHVAYLLSILAPSKQDKVKMTIVSKGAQITRIIFVTESDNKTQSCYMVAPAIPENSVGSKAA